MLDLFSKGILGFFDKVGFFWDSVSVPSRLPFIILDILIVSLLFYWLYLLIRETRAWRIFLGLLIIFLVMIISKLLGLTTLNWIFKNFITMLVVAIPVVFQPELRTALEKLGRVRLAEYPQRTIEIEKIINEIVTACETMANNETGALIVIQRRTGLKDFAETGTILNADLSAPLLINIFQKKAPLHDGAVIVVGNKIKAAGCLLPLEETQRRALGARHQAALSLSKETDAVIVVVSEERKSISVVVEGKITSGLSPFDLKQRLLNEMRGEK